VAEQRFTASRISSKLALPCSSVHTEVAMKKLRTYLQTTASAAGFTMIELLVAATILAVLSAIGLVSFSSANIRARDGKRKADLESARSALELYRSDIGYYPKNMSLSSASWDSVITTISSAGYLSSTSLQDPKNTGSYVYQFSSNAAGTTYQVCAYLETTDASYCLDNP
jgi:prepilin-type N-terminal cleavage/methylation domain-containing protein